MERFAKEIVNHFKIHLNLSIAISDLEVPPDPQFGDFAFPCFKLAQQEKRSPAQIAKRLHQALIGKIPNDLQIHAIGPYLNFKINAQTTFHHLLKDILDGSSVCRYGALPQNSQGTWVLEYSSPNVAKPLNIYHLRTTALGAALDRIARYRGYHVISMNHLGDWGKQYGLLAVAFQRYGKTLEDSISLKQLVEMYVKINLEAETDPWIEEEAKKAFIKLENKDPQITALWEKCVQLSVQEFQRIYQRLHIQFDYVWGESRYQSHLNALLEELKQKKLLKMSEGAWIVPVTDPQGEELPPCLLKKGDGGTLYATRDLAAAIERYQKFQFDRMTYIVGAEQTLHFKQIFSVLQQMGHTWVDRCEHVPTGLYRLGDTKMSTRTGNFITLEDVLEQAKSKVMHLIQKRIHTYSPEQMEIPMDRIAEKIAIGAVVFHDLYHDPARDVEFNIEQMIDFEGETGPYLQYAHTRCLSILRKAFELGQCQKGSIEFFEAGVTALQTPEELKLIKTLGQFPLHLNRTLEFAKASQLAHYLIEVTRCFNAFYRECQVLDQKPSLTQSRLMLVEATRRILAQGLSLLGVPLPEWM